MAFVISRSSPIGELVMNHPVAAAVLLEHGFHCIGCGLSAYETLEQGAAAHGFDDATVDAIVQEIKDAVKREDELLKNPAARKLPCEAEWKISAAKEEKSKKAE